MSGFEMHHFRSIDRPLSPKEMDEIDTWSSRFSPTSTGITYIYHYSSFKKSVSTVFPKYFDAMLYVDNWGTKQLMFRFPKSLVDWEELTKYVNIKDEISLDFEKVGDYVIMDLCWREEDGGEWMDEEDYSLDALIPLREEILNGDYRMLFLAWLIVQEKSGQDYDDVDDGFDEDEPQELLIPHVPANLHQFTATQRHLMQVFLLDEDLAKAAVELSPNSSQQAPNYTKLIQQLTVKEKDYFLQKMMSGEKRVEIELRKKLEVLSGKKNGLAFGKPIPWTELMEMANKK